MAKTWMYMGHCHPSHFGNPETWASESLQDGAPSRARVQLPTKSGEKDYGLWLI